MQINLTVLATAHAVSEGIVSGVSGEMARKSAPQTYGASGRPNLPRRAAAAPLAVSRLLVTLRPGRTTPQHAELLHRPFGK
jgi:hypothetical protein